MAFWGINGHLGLMPLGRLSLSSFQTVINLQGNVCALIATPDNAHPHSMDQNI